MNPVDVSEVADQLASTNIDEKEVSFAKRSLKLDTEDDAKEIVEAINNCPGMTCLNMEGNTLGHQAAKAISKALEGQPSFQRALWKDMFTGRLKTEIPDALRYLSGGIMLANAHLAELDLSDNAFGPIGVEGIVELLRSESCFTLKILRLMNNGLGIGGGKLLAQALTNCHERSSKAGKPFALKVFVCGRNRLEDPGARAFGEVFKKLCSLEEVVMPQNGIYHKGVSAIAEGLSFNPGLKVVNLNDNTFTEKGAVAFSKALTNLQKLEVINFGDCILRTKGAKALADAIKDGHTSLKVVNFGYNEIRKEGGIAIVQAMKNKDNLEELELDGNQFGDDAIEKLENIMESLGKLDKLCAFSDDETPSSGEEEEEEDVDEEGEEEDGEKEDQDEEVQEVKEEKQEAEIAEENAEVTAASFLAEPSASKLLHLGNNRASKILEVVQLSSPTVETYLQAFIKVSSVVTPGNDKVVSTAVECSDYLLEAAFKLAAENDSSSHLTNALLVHFGLIKCEDKSFKPAPDLQGPLTVLEQLLRKEYFLSSTKEVLQLFLSKPNKALDQCGKVKHSFLRTLFQFS